MLVKSVSEVSRQSGVPSVGSKVAEKTDGNAYGEGVLKLDEKYGAAQKSNPLWKGGKVLLSQARELHDFAKEKFDRGMKEHKDRIDRANKQNRETNTNVEHINRELDRVSREMQEKREQKEPKN